MVASITRIESALNILMNQILFAIFAKYLNFATFPEDLLAIFMLQFCPAVW
jgi:hypothetical protein